MADTPLSSAANRLLSPVVVRAVIEPTYETCRLVAEAVDELTRHDLANGARTMRTLIWRCYRWLATHHRNDHIYRHAVIDQMASLDDSLVVMQEARINRSVADYLLVSDHLHVIEVKSDLDNVRRLTSQLRDYQHAAPRVSVLGSRRIVERLAASDEFETVGLYWLDTDGIVQSERSAEFMAERLDSVTMMRSLRRHEYLGILERLNGELPELPNTKVFAYARDITRSIDPTLYHREMVHALGQRHRRLKYSTLARVPAPLRSTVLKLDPTRDGLDRLRGWLDQEIVDVLA